MIRGLLGAAMGAVGSDGTRGTFNLQQIVAFQDTVPLIVWQPLAFAIFFIAALAHDFFYLLFYTDLHVVRFIVIFVTQAFPSALYTALAGFVIHMVVELMGIKVVRGSIGKARS